MISSENMSPEGLRMIYFQNFQNARLILVLCSQIHPSLGQGEGYGIQDLFRELLKVGRQERVVQYS